MTTASSRALVLVTRLKVMAAKHANIKVVSTTKAIIASTRVNPLNREGLLRLSCIDATLFGISHTSLRLCPHG